MQTACHAVKPISMDSSIRKEKNWGNIDENAFEGSLSLDFEYSCFVTCFRYLLFLCIWILWKWNIYNNMWLNHISERSEAERKT